MLDPGGPMQVALMTATCSVAGAVEDLQSAERGVRTRTRLGVEPTAEHREVAMLTATWGPCPSSKTSWHAHGA